jgi:hypothetical protein
MVLCAETDEGGDFVFKVQERRVSCEREKICELINFILGLKEEKLHASEATSLIRVG